MFCHMEYNNQNATNFHTRFQIPSKFVQCLVSGPRKPICQDSAIKLSTYLHDSPNHDMIPIRYEIYTTNNSLKPDRDFQPSRLKHRFSYHARSGFVCAPVLWYTKTKFSSFKVQIDLSKI